MPVVEATDRIAPKSILRHRPIGDSTPPTRKKAATATVIPPVAQRASRPRSADVDTDEIVAWQQTSDRATTQSSRATEAKRTATAAKAKSLPRIPHPKLTLPRKRTFPPVPPLPPLPPLHPLLYLGLGMVAMLMLWMIASAIWNWGGTVLDDLRYGRPRTFQTDAWVGHNEQTGIPSHFIAVNLNRHIEVIEISGGDAAHTHIYVGPQLYGPNDDLAPVTLSFVDVNHDHKLDMIINVQGSRIVYINDQGGFRPLLPSERQQVAQFLRHL